MNLRKIVKATSLAFVGITMFTGVAMAFPATSKSALNVRSGPGTNYGVVDALYSGEKVDVTKCNSANTWCYITHNGPNGWVAANYLQRSGSGGGNNGGNNGGGSSAGYVAKATAALNVRSNPRPNSRVVDALYSGERVNVERCRNSWCYITHTGPDGWVSSRYLQRVGGGNNGGDNDNNDPNFNIQFGSNGQFSFSFGNRPSPNFQKGKACFYSQRNFKGQSFCIEEGKSVAQLGNRWNDKISSIKLSGDVQVVACKHKNFGGFCNTFSRDIRQLGPFLNNEITSLKIR